LTDTTKSINNNKTANMATKTPKCANDWCSCSAAKNEYYPNSEGGEYWTLCEECYIKDQEKEEEKVNKIIELLLQLNEEEREELIQRVDEDPILSKVLIINPNDESEEEEEE